MKVAIWVTYALCGFFKRLKMVSYLKLRSACVYTY